MSLRKLIRFVVCFALLPGALAAQQVEYYHLDALGSVRGVTDESGAIVVRHDYYPYGEEWNEPASQDSRRFTGKERDDESGLDYFGARYYGPKTAQFASVDPVMTVEANLADPQRWNRHSYGRSNPLRFLDPDGRELRTAATQTILDIAGPAAARVRFVDGTVDVSGLQASDLSNNEGVALLVQLAASKNVYVYEEGPTMQTAGGVRTDVTSGAGAARNLDKNPDWRIPNKGQLDLPPGGVDAVVGLDPSISFTNLSGTLGVSVPARAFHELAEAYGKVDKGLQHTPQGGGAGAHEDARVREQTLIQQRPGFTQFPAGEVIKRVP